MHFFIDRNGEMFSPPAEGVRLSADELQRASGAIGMLTSTHFSTYEEALQALTALRGFAQPAALRSIAQPAS